MGLVVFSGALFVVCGLVASVGWVGCLLVLLDSNVGCYCCLDWLVVLLPGCVGLCLLLLALGLLLCFW